MLGDTSMRAVSDSDGGDGRSGRGLPLTAAQLGIWHAQQLDPLNAAFRGGEYLEIAGPVDAARLERAVRRVREEAETLRVVVLDGPEGPRQYVEAAGAWPLPVVDLRGERDPLAAAERAMRRELATPLEIGAPGGGPLFGSALFVLADDRHLWFHHYHHLVADGFTVAAVARRVAELYNADGPDGAASGPGFLPLAGLVEADADYRASGLLATDREFWAGRLAGAPAPASLSTRPPVPPRERIRRGVVLDAAALDRLRDAAYDADVPWPTVVLTAVALYVQRTAGADEAVLGVPVTTRLGRLSRSTPGMVSNLLPLRVALRPAMTVGEALLHVAGRLREAMRHQRYRYEDLRREHGGGPERPLVGPQVNVMAFTDVVTFDGHRATVRNLSIGPTDDFSVVVHVSPDGGGLHIDLDGNADRYDAAELAAHETRLLHVLEGLADADGALPTGRLDVLPPAQRERALPPA
ncbi:condensation domain-containing protein, partial [Streptomyces sp. SBT349]|uniref:condensation domain-containing protein n=1 Tax=Streptomyces sp. SBT349 TaxID=1580539 RepID=UPI001F339213